VIRHYESRPMAGYAMGWRRPLAVIARSPCHDRVPPTASRRSSKSEGGSSKSEGGSNPALPLWPLDCFACARNDVVSSCTNLSSSLRSALATTAFRRLRVGRIVIRHYESRRWRLAPSLRGSRRITIRPTKLMFDRKRPGVLGRPVKPGDDDLCMDRLQAHSRPFFFMISGAFSLVMSMVGKVMTGSSFSPFSSLTAWRRPSAPGVA
jgi:hypothetical protein